MNKIIVVIGKARAGKTTFSKYLSTITGAKCAGTSDVVYKYMALARNVDVKELYKIPKEELRPNLISFANALCEVYPIFLSEALIKNGVSIIEGVRRKSELDALRNLYDVYAVYIDRDQGTVSDNFEMDHHDADHIVINHSDLDSLYKATQNFWNCVIEDENIITY
jgi:cytidylate kinase